MPLTTLEWEPPRYMQAYSRLSAAIVDELYAMCTMSREFVGHDLYRLPLHDWPPAAVDVLQSQMRVLGETGQSRLLEADAEANGTTVLPSTVPGAGLGVFATRQLSVNEHILPFFGQLVYHDLQVPGRSGRERSYNHLYGARTIRPSLATTARNWMLTGLQLRTGNSMWQVASGTTQADMVPSAVLTRIGSSSLCTYNCPVWIVPSDLCAGGRVNDPRPSLTANAKYVQRFDPVFFCDQLVMADCAHLQVKRTILPGQEVLAAYGRRYPLQEALGCQSQSASGGR